MDSRLLKFPSCLLIYHTRTVKLKVKPQNHFIPSSTKFMFYLTKIIPSVLFFRLLSIDFCLHVRYFVISQYTYFWVFLNLDYRDWNGRGIVERWRKETWKLSFFNTNSCKTISELIILENSYKSSWPWWISLLWILKRLSSIYLLSFWLQFKIWLFNLILRLPCANYAKSASSIDLPTLYMSLYESVQVLEDWENNFISTSHVV